MALRHPGSGGKDAWAVSAADRDHAGGMPVFIVDHQLLYHSAGTQYWLHAYHIELAGIITPTTVPEAVRKDKSHRGVLGSISRPTIGVAARTLHRELERSGWVFLH